MFTQFKKIQLLLLVLFILILVSSRADDIITRIKDTPYTQREMRAVWVATVANIDWPSGPGLPVEEQKKEAIAILDRVKELNMNVVVLQVRPQALSVSGPRLGGNDQRVHLSLLDHRTRVSYI